MDGPESTSLGYPYIVLYKIAEHQCVFSDVFTSTSRYLSVIKSSDRLLMRKAVEGPLRWYIILDFPSVKDCSARGGVRFIINVNVNNVPAQM